MLIKDTDWILNIFNFKKNFPLLSIEAIGRHRVIDSNYYWNNMDREEDGNYCLFQFTISGSGEFKINGKTYTMDKNKGFFIEIPGEHLYYLPKNSTAWEVLYIEFSIEAKPFYEEIIKNYGSNIFEFSNNSRFISLMWEAFYSARNNEITNIFEASQIGYNLIFELLKFSNKKNIKKNSEIIESVKKYIHKNYTKPIAIEDMAKYAAFSKFHLTRKFKEEIGISPGQYLIRTRLKNATNLLLNTNKSIEEISEDVGFSCGNYFAKAFKNKFKISPTKYRNLYKTYTNVTLKE